MQQTNKCISNNKCKQKKNNEQGIQEEGEERKEEENVMKQLRLGNWDKVALDRRQETRDKRQLSFVMLRLVKVGGG